MDQVEPRDVILSKYISYSDMIYSYFGFLGCK